MRSSILPPITLAVFMVLEVHGYAQTKPVITAIPVPTEVQMLDIKDLEADALIHLQWSATHDVGFAQYRWELTLGRARDEQNQTVPILQLLNEPLCDGDCEGRSDSGTTYSFQIYPSDIITSSTAVDDAVASLWLRVFRNGSFLSEESDTYEWRFEYDNRPPPAPELVELVPGERRFEVRWSLPSSRGSDIETVAIGYCADIGGTVTSSSGTLDALPCSGNALRTKSGIARTEDSFDIRDGLQNGVPAAVALRATDRFGNVGDFGNVLFETPREATDFWELYREQGGGEDGGFCFVATAAHGSYAHPVVRILRTFRDRVLGQTPLSRGLTYAYYRLSPGLAARVAASEELGQAARIGLIPVAVVAVLVLGLPFLGVMVLGVLMGRLLRRWGSKPAWGRAFLGVWVVLAVPISEARAEQRPDSALESVGLGLEFRGGPYLPALGHPASESDEPGAFRQIFGTKSNPLFTLGMELQVYRGVGTVAVGGSFGFMQWVGRSINQNNELTTDTTVFNLLPLTLTVAYRFDWLADHTLVPLVPYVRGGLAYSIWWTTNGRGDISRVPNPDGDPFVGRGGTLGVTGSIGLAFLLNVIDSRAAHALFEATNIRGTYIFAELTSAKVDGFGGDGFDLSDATWSLGLFLEL